MEPDWRQIEQENGGISVRSAHFLGEGWNSLAYLVNNDGERWGWPGGRPEGDESWEQTLRREVLEEACATVVDARLLGFTRAVCLTGHEPGLVLARSIWLAEVELLPWEPRYEIAHRRVVPATELLAHLWMEQGFEPIYHRALVEAGIVSYTPSELDSQLMRLT